ncbi:hypothetical protein OIU84_012089 [Salix udensis]|uniref:Uncharacterized protein n=1 Tax=Salix udensis TaxID=889485 RepID=A0AAD6JEX6_9ROSI|nr:hypothetical protein OIU84_012089 [Salix udensis]
MNLVHIQKTRITVKTSVQGVDSSTTSVHVTALDGIVNVNSLFTVAVFVGLSLATPNQTQPRKPRLLRRRRRRGQESTSLRGCVLQFLPLLFSGRTRPETGYQFAEQ